MASSSSPPPNRQTITVGLSGSQSSGKTTLTALLTFLLPPSSLITIHADDFCKEFDELPTNQGVLDADSVESVHFDRLKACLQHVLETGTLPESYEIHDFIAADLKNASAKFDHEFVEEMRGVLRDASIDWTQIKAVVLVDGFLLYHDPDLRSSLDIKLFLRTSKETARQRRFGRYGEGAAPEGSEEFWKTASYFDKIAWRNYVKEHGFLFPSGDVEAEVDRALMLERFGIWTPEDVDLEVEKSMRWAVEALAEGLERQAPASK